MNGLFILNRTAGLRDPEELSRLETLAGELGLRTLITNGAGHATEIVRSTPARRVLVAGGDDTVREVIAGLDGASLGIVPTGTFNVFARSLGVVEDPDQAMRDALTGPDTLVDLAQMDHLLFNESAGVGLVAEAFAQAPDQSVKGFARWLAGARAALSALSDTHSETYRLIMDDTFEFQMEAVNITVANVALVASGVPWMPQADPTDGLLDIAVLPPRSPLEMLAELPAVFDPEEESGTVFRAAELTIIAERPSVFRYDGLVTEPLARVTIRCLPGALRVCNAHL